MKTLVTDKHTHIGQAFRRCKQEKNTLAVNNGSRPTEVNQPINEVDYFDSI